MLTLLLNTWLLSYPKLLPPFCHECKSSSHLIVTGRASILILIIIIIVVGVIIIVLVLRCVQRRRGRLYESTKASLPSSNMADTGVHLITLSSECIKASLYALKLRHDRLKGHTTRRWRRCRCGRSGRSWRRRCPCPWPLQSNLSLAPSDGAASMAHITIKWGDLG